MRIVSGATRLVCGTLASMLCLVSCAPPFAAEREPPPSDASASKKWDYAAALLSNGDAREARGYLEALTETGQPEVGDPALLWRDLAEARLFSGDLSGAVAAADRARQELAAEPDTAQFTADDRHLFERTIEALGAAATNDQGRLDALAADERVAPSADAAYLVGWLDEQAGDLSDARTAFRAFLDRAPQWVFLRQAFEMRRHAQLVVQ